MLQHGNTPSRWPDNCFALCGVHWWCPAGTFHAAFLDELRDAYHAEKQLTKALPKMATAATSPVLRDTFESHLEETRGHVELMSLSIFGRWRRYRELLSP